jgi:hypothetical protein
LDVDARELVEEGVQGLDSRGQLCGDIDLVEPGFECFRILLILTAAERSALLAFPSEKSELIRLFTATIRPLCAFVVGSRGYERLAATQTRRAF